MTCDGAMSTVAKWNLIGGIPFRHVKNYQCSHSEMVVFMVDKRKKVFWSVHCGYSRG